MTSAGTMALLHVFDLAVHESRYIQTCKHFPKPVLPSSFVTVPLTKASYKVELRVRVGGTVFVAFPSLLS